ncbi:hypothetical protein MtrunA17_Chr8g0359461 [Medicago truncatula]|uniref:Uncharacterized protein n=1 Tax=Medicago truncatula TaxID=3880 RepID=A0A396GQ58_MEDTR|nr:hypothetical protein MtrunA17_Chr8g0359461 [Medicago truncatula]
MWNLGGCNGGNFLEVLILRDCMHLKEVGVIIDFWWIPYFISKTVSEMLIIHGQIEVARLLIADISNREGLACEADWYRRCYNSTIMPIKQVLEARPGMRVVAEYPSEGRLDILSNRVEGFLFQKSSF